MNLNKEVLLSKTTKMVALLGFHTDYPVVC